MLTGLSGILHTYCQWSGVVVQEVKYIVRTSCPGRGVCHISSARLRGEVRGTIH